VNGEVRSKKGLTGPTLLEMLEMSGKPTYQELPSGPVPALLRNSCAVLPHAEGMALRALTRGSVALDLGYRQVYELRACELRNYPSTQVVVAKGLLKVFVTHVGIPFSCLFEVLQTRFLFD